MYFINKNKILKVNKLMLAQINNQTYPLAQINRIILI